jgi:DNA-binding transcriptional MocR family regulator
MKASLKTISVKSEIQTIERERHESYAFQFMESHSQSHIDEVEDFYRFRRDAMHQAAEKHLSGLCQWTKPNGGMFLWIRKVKI